MYCCCFNGTDATDIYTYRHPLSLHDALPISRGSAARRGRRSRQRPAAAAAPASASVPHRRWQSARWSRRRTEVAREHHISSAVVSAVPQHAQAVAAALARLPDTEVHHVVGGKIVIVMEGPSQGAIGGRLTQIALMDHVLAANLVYELIETEGSGESGHDPHQ